MKNLLLSIALFTSYHLFAQGALTCDTATTITTNGTYSIGALTSGTYPSGVAGLCFNQSALNPNARWYKFTPSTDGLITVSSDIASNSTVADTRLSILTGSCTSPWTCIAYNDDVSEATSNYRSAITNVTVNAGTTYYIMWDDYWDSGNYSFTFNYVVPTCYMPTDFILLNTPTTTSATIGWTAPADGTPTGYEFEYGLNGFTQGTGTLLTTTVPSVSLTNLTPSSTYSYYVRTNCGTNDYSLWAGPISFNAVFEPTSVPYTTSFENGIPAGWTILAGGDTAETWEIRELYAPNSNIITAQNGIKNVVIFTGTTAHNDFLVTPLFNIVAGISDKLTFWARANSAQFPETISVKASTTTPTETGMTTVLEASIAPPNGSYFTKYTIDLSSLVGQSIHIGFHSTTTNNSTTTTTSYFEIDNVVVGSTPSCVEPISPLTFSEITPTSAVVSWTSATPAPALGYEIYISNSPTAPTPTSIPTATVTSGTTFSITGLVGSTKYYVYVRSKCSATESSVWGHLGTVITLLEPTTPPYSFNFDSGLYSNLGWTISDTGGFWNNYIASSAAPAHSGGYFIGSPNSSTVGNNSWVYTRGLILQANSVNTINFYAKNFGTANLPQSLKLTVGNAPNNASQTTTLYTSTTLQYTDWTLITATYTPTETGVYYLGFNHFSPAQAQYTMLAIDTFSITSVLSNNEFKLNKITLYPNPTNSILNIQTDKIIERVTIIDVSGRTTNAKIASNNSIDVSSLSSGMYFIEIKTTEGLFREKFIKN